MTAHAMVTYEVTTIVEPDLVEAYERYMRQHHDRYLEKHATRLREEFASYFPRGVTAAREVWVAIQSWTVGADDSELA